jgi:glycosyltransferase involved in cell wall biosynthesis
MRICIIGKYPPIEGGVSTETYWCARGLATRGHQVVVVTNADEVDHPWRISLTAADYESEEYQGRFGDFGGSVRVTSTTLSEVAVSFHIPFSNPSVTRLAAMATDVVRSEKCDVIYASYLEPYAVAAHLASGWTGVPYVVKHAGSDLAKLAQSPGLRTTYFEVLKSAKRIVSSIETLSRFLPSDVYENRVAPIAISGIPTEYFHPGARPLNIQEFTSNDTGCLSTTPLEPNWPVLGIYGKLGERKGSFDLLHAIAQLAADHFPVHLIAMAHGRQEDRFRRLIEELDLARYVRIFPFLPNWRIPGFIRRCTAIACLEEMFEIALHTSVIPLEVVACGTCLVVSEEVARKQPFRSRIRNGQNIVIVSTPKDHASLAASLRYALEDNARAAEIGCNGHRDLPIGCTYGEAVDNLESLLSQVCDDRVGSARDPRFASNVTSPTGLELVRPLFPLTTAIVDTMQHKMLRDFMVQHPLDACASSDEVPKYVARSVDSCSTDLHSRQLVAVCRYESMAASWQARRQVVSRAMSEMTAEGKLSSDAIPCLSCDFEFEEFSFDLTAATKWLKENRCDTPVLDGTTRILFSSCEEPLIVGQLLSEVFVLLQTGTLTIGEIASLLPTSCDAGPDETVKALSAILEGLCWTGLVSFKAPEGSRAGVR